jgi:BASS family bile acid:Na+ symporter
MAWPKYRRSFRRQEGQLMSPDRIAAVTARWIERGLLAWLVLLSLLALVWPAVFPGVWDPFTETKPALDGLIAVTMLAIGSLLPRDEVRQVARQWPRVIGGTAVQYAAMPLLAFAVAMAMGLRGPMLTGVIMVGCVPGAMASNVLTLAARGNVSYSVGLTTTATLLSPLLVPLTLKLTLGQWRPFPAGEVAMSLLLTVVLPVVVGYGLSTFSRAWQRGAEAVGSIIANLTILWIIALVVGLNRDRLTQIHVTMLAALLLINLGGYLAGNFGGRALRLSPSMRRALTLEVGMQNAGLGTFLVLKVFESEPTAAIPTALYTFGCMLTGTMLAQWWAIRGREGEG